VCYRLEQVADTVRMDDTCSVMPPAPLAAPAPSELLPLAPLPVAPDVAPEPLVDPLPDAPVADDPRPALDPLLAPEPDPVAPEPDDPDAPEP